MHQQPMQRPWPEFERIYLQLRHKELQVHMRLQQQPVRSTRYCIAGEEHGQPSHVCQHSVLLPDGSGGRGDDAHDFTLSANAARPLGVGDGKRDLA